MHLVILSGSERAGGNTDQISIEIVRYVAKQSCTGEIITLREKKIMPCGYCEDCNTKAAPCGILDDVPEILSRLKKADAIIYAVPVHGFGMSHILQVFIERLGVGYLRFERPLANKLGGAVVVGRRYSHAAVLEQLQQNILLNRMILVGSGFPAILHGGAPGSINSDREGLASLYAMLDRMIDFHFGLNGAYAAILQRCENERLQLARLSIEQE